MKKVVFFLFALLIVYSCEKEAKIVFYEESDYEKLSKQLNLAELPANYKYSLKAPTGVISYLGNESNLITMGRVLFYDKSLSKDNSVSCASCHDQKKGFSDNKDFSMGTENRMSTRNSIALGSVLNFQVYYGPGRVPFFWDNRVDNMKSQIKSTLQNKNEMGMSLDLLNERVKNDEKYQILSKYLERNSFQNESEMALAALEAFVNSFKVNDTKYDQAAANSFGSSIQTNYEKDFSGFTSQENDGKKIYVKQCGSCHGMDITAPAELSANNGLTSTIDQRDLGLGGNSRKPEQMGLFKVPTLRNVMLTAPYMHDGSLKTIDDVLNHYTNVKDHPNLSAKFKVNGKLQSLKLTESDKSNLKAFLSTLTSDELIKAEKFSNPFKF